VAVAGGVDEMAITHLDRRTTWPVCKSWGHSDDLLGRALGRAPTFESQRQLADEVGRLEQSRFEVEILTSTQLAELVDASCRSYGPTAEDKRWGKTVIRQ